MSIHLIDGHAGRAHISSEDVARLNIAVTGAESGVFDYKERLRATTIGSSAVAIHPGAAMVGGRRFTVTSNEQVELQGGTDGLKRIDIVYAQYGADGGGIETVELRAARGTPLESNPEPPAVPAGALPLWRVPFDGAAMNAPARLFEVLPTLESVRVERLYENDFWRVVRHGGAVSVFARGVITGQGAHDSLDCKYRVPEGLRPAVEVLAACCTQGGDGGAGFLRVRPDGVISMGQLGGTGTRQPRYAQLTWVPGM